MDVYKLRLYVAGQTPKSIAALANLKHICEAHLAGRYEIEVIDLLVSPKLAAGHQKVRKPVEFPKFAIHRDKLRLQPLRVVAGNL